MSTNQRHMRGKAIVLPVASGVTSGAPCVCGQIPGVAETDRDANGNAAVNTEGTYAIAVKAIDGGGNSAVVAGDILYHTAADTPPVSKKNTGVRFGYAENTDPATVNAAVPNPLIAAGATATIQVRLGY